MREELVKIPAHTRELQNSSEQLGTFVRYLGPAMAGQVQQLSLPQPVLDLYLRDHSVLIVDEYELSSRHPLQHRIGLVQWNLLNSFQLLKHNR